MLTEFSPKIPKFFCDYCNIRTNNKKDYEKHLLTQKHTKLTNVNNLLTDFSQGDYMETFSDKLVAKSCDTKIKMYYCEYCHYKTDRKSRYEKNLTTAKHRKILSGDKKLRKLRKSCKLRKKKNNPKGC
jgi:hypothetical protein